MPSPPNIESLPRRPSRTKRGWLLRGAAAFVVVGLSLWLVAQNVDREAWRRSLFDKPNRTPAPGSGLNSRGVNQPQETPSATALATALDAAPADILKRI